MKSGFKDTLDHILRSYGMKTSNTIGTVVSGGKLPHQFQLELKKLGYRVERGLDQPNYDFVILTKGQSSISNINRALTKIDNGCIIVFRPNLTWDTSYSLASLFPECRYYEIRPNTYFGVIVKGTVHEGKS